MLARNCTGNVEIFDEDRRGLTRQSVRILSGFLIKVLSGFCQDFRQGLRRYLGGNVGQVVLI